MGFASDIIKEAFALKVNQGRYVQNFSLVYSLKPELAGDIHSLKSLYDPGT